jgi:hypothetical protein
MLLSLEYFNPGNLPRSSHDSQSDMSRVSRVPTLMEFSCYGMGRIAIDLDDDELENFYDFVQPHFRTLVLFEHLVQMLIRDMPLDELLPWFSEECGKRFYSLYL